MKENVNKLMFSLLFVALVMTMASCIEFKKIGLYDQPMAAEILTPPAKISLAVATTLFKDDTLDIWGVEKDSCKNIRLVHDVTDKGDGALELEWDRGECIWAGIGMGWDGWAGKDLSEIQQVAAIQMRVRNHKGRVFGLPIVLTLEDYSDVQSYAYVANKYFERTVIDEEWQTIRVPLAAFDFEKDGIDPTNVKQLMFELQGSGHIYLDEVQMVDYVAPPEEIWMEEPVYPDPTVLPQVLFDDAFINNHGWGIFNYGCQEIGYVTEAPQSGEKAISVKWNYVDNDHCDSRAIGVSWGNWQEVDVQSMMDKAVISFYVKVAQPSAAKALPVEVGLEAYDGRGMVKVPLSTDWISGDRFTGEWQEVNIPFSKLEGKADLKKIKNLRFNFMEKGQIYLDNIRLVEK